GQDLRHVPPDHPPDVDPHLVLLRTSRAHYRVPSRPGRPGGRPAPVSYPAGRRMVSMRTDPLKPTRGPIPLGPPAGRPSVRAVALRVFAPEGRVMVARGETPGPRPPTISGSPGGAAD